MKWKENIKQITQSRKKTNTATPSPNKPFSKMISPLAVQLNPSGVRKSSERIIYPLKTSFYFLFTLLALLNKRLKLTLSTTLKSQNQNFFRLALFLSFICVDLRVSCDFLQPVFSTFRHATNINKSVFTLKNKSCLVDGVRRDGTVVWRQKMETHSNIPGVILQNIFIIRFKFFLFVSQFHSAVFVLFLSISQQLSHRRVGCERVLILQDNTEHLTLTELMSL